MFAELLRARLAGAPALSDFQVNLLEDHYRLLARWNRVLNLTSIDHLEDVVVRHYCESLFVGQVLNPAPQSICDIGSGAGFPGFPLAVLRPDCSVSLIESHQRKAVFLKEASRALPNVRVMAKRAREVAEHFDWAVSRAVSYEDLDGCLPRLGSKVALLTGAEVPPPELAYSWRDPIQLPWGKHRFLRVGQCMPPGAAMRST